MPPGSPAGSKGSPLLAFLTLGVGPIAVGVAYNYLATAILDPGHDVSQDSGCPCTTPPLAPKTG